MKKKFTLYYAGSVSRKQMDQIRRTCPNSKPTPERIRQIKASAKLYLKGMKVSEIAERFEVSDAAVYSWLHHEGVEVVRTYSYKEKLGMARMYGKGHSVQKVAAKFGCSTATVASAARAFYVPVRSPGRVAKAPTVGYTGNTTGIASVVAEVIKALKDKGVI